jgi:hypothetical protein
MDDKVAEFRKNAEFCRRLAGSDGSHKMDLLKMAQAWEELATERERKQKNDS